MHAGQKGILVAVGAGMPTEPGTLPLPKGAVEWSGATIAEIRTAQGITSLLPTAVPAKVPLCQYRAAIGSAAQAVIDANIANLAEPKQNQMSALWNYGNEITRKGTLAAYIVKVRSQTDAQMDADFRAASAIVP